MPLKVRPNTKNADKIDPGFRLFPLSSKNVQTGCALYGLQRQVPADHWGALRVQSHVHLHAHVCLRAHTHILAHLRITLSSQAYCKHFKSRLPPLFLSVCCLLRHTWWPSHASTSSASNRLPPSQPSSYHSPSHSLSLKAAADSPFSYSPASRTSSSPCSLSSPPSHFPHASPSLTLTSHWSPPDATVPGTCLEGSSPPRPDEAEDEREPAEQKTQSNAGDSRIATDTLELSWGDVIESNAGNAETWKHLLSVDGQVVQIDLDELHRMRQFKYLGPTRLRLDAFFFLMGLPISFFSRIQEKRKGGDVADLMAFFSEEEHWFEALLHPRMAKFLRLQQRRLAKDDRINQYVQTAIQNLQGKREDNHQSPMASATIPESRNLSPIKKDTSATVGFDTTTPPSESRIGPAIEGFGLDKTNETNGNTQQNEAEIGEADKKSFPAGESLSKQRQFEQIHLNADFLATFHEGMGRDVKRMIQAELIDFLREHNDELQAFYLPPKETPGQKAGPDA
ncbi:hypothetical protein TGRUB_312435 [Toxoplasma gondii RUB]|uniref:Uncharacterized protein n=1 Tax=Toxoplasma gondii RUB TaxID=935652 RepID=A0A086MAU9_TOXGO|nr:hypothetical protein TGRUB_312435 [Toxoplasma gondii RUB]